MIEPVLALQRALAEHLSWHGARLNFLARFLLALLKVRSVNLAELATGFGGQAQVASSYKRLQRFFRVFEIDYEALARFLVHLFPVGEGPWYLTLDRTHWKFGQTEINFLILGIAHQGMALPLMWSVLDKAGNSAPPSASPSCNGFSSRSARLESRPGWPIGNSSGRSGSRGSRPNACLFTSVFDAIP